MTVKWYWQALAAGIAAGAPVAMSSPEFSWGEVWRCGWVFLAGASAYFVGKVQDPPKPPITLDPETKRITP